MDDDLASGFDMRSGFMLKVTYFLHLSKLHDRSSLVVQIEDASRSVRHAIRHQSQ